MDKNGTISRAYETASPERAIPIYMFVRGAVGARVLTSGRRGGGTPGAQATRS